MSTIKDVAKLAQVSIGTVSNVLNGKTKNEEKKTDEVMQEMIKAYAIKIGKPDDMILTLSGGNQQKVVIAKWIGNHPEILGYEICSDNLVKTDRGDLFVG